MLPASYTGGKRYMYEAYQDCQSLVWQRGRPSLFITMTTNPMWPEIQRELLPSQTAPDRPDIVARVFKLKLNRVWKDITKKNIFGRVVGGTFVVEYQKRGLPHAHMLIILHPDDRPTSPEDFDKIVSAELPNKATHPNLWTTVTSTLLHGPCGRINPGQVCMENGKCRFKYPYRFQEYTTVEDGSYPRYRRRDNGSTATHRGHATLSNFTFNNRWVVPYSPYLVAKYDCHINVQIATSIEAVKYLYKYIFKGNPQAAFDVVEEDRILDEVADYLKGRYICPIEACYRCFEGDVERHFPPVIRLDIHEEGERSVVIAAETTLASLDSGKLSKLEAFFKYCATTGSDLLYHEAPENLTWQERSSTWQPRQRRMDVIGRIYYVSPRRDNVSFEKGRSVNISFSTSACCSTMSVDPSRSVISVQWTVKNIRHTRKHAMLEICCKTTRNGTTLSGKRVSSKPLGLCVTCSL